MVKSQYISTGFGGLWPRVIALLLAACSAGCVSPGPIGSETQPNVFVMRGPAGYFPNLAEFEERLVAEGTCPTVAYPDAEGAIAERIIGGRNRGRLNGPIVIVGYSSGAPAAVSLSNRLGSRGIEVDKLVLVESTEASVVPQNVQACLNIYKSQPWARTIPAFTGHPVSAAGATTDLVNYDVREYNDGRFDYENHLTLAANPHVQDLMIDEILETFDPQEPEPESSKTETPTPESPMPLPGMEIDQGGASPAGEPEPAVIEMQAPES
ncbi:MAG: hypothetical protein JSS02_09820 [Planctomycetes bacterium]|nr:hypothetical protein [Planctomycetota bacterium]